MNLAGTWNVFFRQPGVVRLVVRRVGLGFNFNVIMCLFLGLGCLIKTLQYERETYTLGAVVLLVSGVWLRGHRPEL